MAISRIGTAQTVAYQPVGNFVVNCPAGTSDGDFMVAFVMTWDGAPSPVPSGWTLHTLNDNGTLMRTYIYAKWATGSEPSTYTWGLDSSADLAGGVIIHTYRGVNLATPIGNTVQSQSVTAEALATGALSVVEANSWLVGVSCCRHTGTGACSCTAPAPLVEIYDRIGIDTVGSFARAMATYDSNTTVTTGSKNVTFTRTGTTAAHNVIMFYLREEADTAKADSDTGTGTEAEAIGASFTQTDTGGSTEGTPSIGVLPTGDTGLGTEANSLLVTFTGTDTGLGTEGSSINAAVSDVETGSGTEGQSLAATLSQGDTGGGEDDGNASGGTTPESSDEGVTVEEFLTLATLLGSDTFTAVENQSVAVPPVPYVPGEFGNTLVMGPAALYIGAYGAVEPANGLVGSIPDPLVWTPLGGTMGGVELSVAQEFKTITLEQLPDMPFNRLEKRYLSIKTPLAETTLTNLGLALNDSAGVTGTAYEPTVYDEGTELVYLALIVDGWAPGVTALGRHKRRRIIVRKCLSVDNITMSYTKDGQTIYNVTWSCHYVDDVTAPFRVIDEA